MARTGVLSDVAIKHHCPEFFPPDIRTQKAMHPVHMQTSIFNGIKVPKETKAFTDFSRFPVNDLKNFATVAAPARTTEAFIESIHNYRRQIGSDNHPESLQNGYAEQMKATHKPYDMKRPESTIVGSSTLSNASTDIADLNSLRHYSTVPASLTLGSHTRSQGVVSFNDEMGRDLRFILPPESRALISNVSGSRVGDVTEIVLPGGVNPRQRPLTHGEVLSRLNEAYRTSSADLSIIQIADAAARARNVVPDRSSFMSSIIGETESRIEEVMEAEGE